MKKVFLPLLMLLFLSTADLKAQIPNGNFETLLSDGSLSNWGNVTLFAVIIDSSGNVVEDSIVFDGPFCSATTDAYSGNYALEMRNAYSVTYDNGISGWASVDEDTTYSAWGSLEFIYAAVKPQNFNFYYKYTSVNGDSGVALLTFYDHMMNEIGNVAMIFSGTNSVYQYASLPVNYISQDSVYAYSLHFNTYYSEAYFPTGANLGTRLLIDELSFSGLTNVENIDQHNKFSIFPNPCKDFFYVQDNSAADYIIHSIDGRTIQNGSLPSDAKIILNKDLPAGIYSLEITANGKVASKKFIVSN